ncbi:hypothetical protein RYZ26_03240 [Terasakiella sp. A23]|uniref:hypothetical protein n=1 Tax=Terasakiella sp. FCG-A23 TaxID=3080561 RepID=UPI0029536C36|nr:hypothetical protein [Terasakiella sp. A23]MDV7338596.1 hypothetical protein [Terasakiella sp. A23]
MEVYQIFRVQFFQYQSMLFVEFPEGREILRRVLAGTLERHLKTRSYYALEKQDAQHGNVYFKFARSRKVHTNEISQGEIVEKEHPDYPFVEVLINIELGVCAIGRNSDFSTSITHSANMLSKLFDSSVVSKELNAVATIDPIIDPTGFIEHLNNAELISKFYFEVKHPNAFDADDFVVPLKKLNKAGRSHYSRTILTGGNLDKEIAEGLSRSSASTGDDAGATMKLPESKKLVRKSLGKNHVFIEAKNKIIDNFTEFSNVLKKKYREVRNANE